MLGSGRGARGTRDPAADPAPEACETLDAPVEPEPPLCAGQTIDRYTIVRLMATGGMARVYEATHAWTHRSVALKIMHARHGCRADLIERFRKEALALSAIAHPNVVSVENGGLTEDGFVFLATELLQGHSLRQLLRDRKCLPISEALELLIQVARGVAAAHAQNVIHRDLKPENIFCTREGAVKVLDLGIAKLIGYDTKETDPNLGFVAGTPAYMAPELLEARPVNVTADVYALGVIAYECLAGRHPLTPDAVWPPPVELARRALAYEPAPLKDVPAELAQLVHRAMHKSAARRHASMALLLEDLERVHGRWARNEAARPASPVRLSGRRRALSSLVLVTALGLSVAAVVQQSAQPRPRTSLASATRRTAGFLVANTTSLSSSAQRTLPTLASVPSTSLTATQVGLPAAARSKRRASRRAPSRLIARTFDVETQPSLAKQSRVRAGARRSH